MNFITFNDMNNMNFITFNDTGKYKRGMVKYPCLLHSLCCQAYL